MRKLPMEKGSIRQSLRVDSIKKMDGWPCAMGIKETSFALNANAQLMRKETCK